jgi:CheY-like chemotaxis protein
MSKRILVVEDQADNREIIRDTLAPTDYEITEVESGEEASQLRQLREIHRNPTRFITGH